MKRDGLHQAGLGSRHHRADVSCLLPQRGLDTCFSSSPSISQGKADSAYKLVNFIPEGREGREASVDDNCVDGTVQERFRDKMG